LLRPHRMGHKGLCKPSPRKRPPWRFSAGSMRRRAFPTQRSANRRIGVPDGNQAPPSPVRPLALAKLPARPFALAKLIGDIATGQVADATAAGCYESETCSRLANFACPKTTYRSPRNIARPCVGKSPRECAHFGRESASTPKASLPRWTPNLSSLRGKSASETLHLVAGSSTRHREIREYLIIEAGLSVSRHVYDHLARPTGIARVLHSSRDIAVVLVETKG